MTPPTAQRVFLAAPTGRLSVEAVGVAPNPAAPILTGINFTVEPGQVVGVVGPSGSGKSTLIRAIAGAEALSESTIRFDGADRHDLDHDQLTRYIGFMPQETLLFAGTIADNISGFARVAGSDSSSIDELVLKAAKLAGAHEMILNLRGGYNHQVEVGGRGLSAGQAQRVALARAVFREPTYPLLDEPNASLDADRDAQLVATMERLKGAGTAIIVAAHRLTMLPLVDMLLVMREGRVAHFGPRDEVLVAIAPRPIPVRTVASGGRS